MILGIDTSTFFEEADNGARFFDGKEEVNPLRLFRTNGVTYMRIRLWNDPYDKEGNSYLGGTCDLKNFIRLAKYATSLGYKILMDFHYSDFWADPGKQFIPKAWEGMEIDELEKCVYEYTKTTLQTIKNEEIDIALAQIGNEITNGMMWPVGRIYDSVNGEERVGYPNLSRLLKAGIKGTKEIYPACKTIVHLERSYDQVIYKEYFTNMEKYHVDYDIIGMSYYPYWHGTFEQFFDNVDMLKANFKKDIMVMELGYAFTLEDYIKTGNGNLQLVVNENNLDTFHFNKPYEFSEEGQAMFVEEFLRLARIHDIKGVFYWEPCWIPGENICWSSKASQQYIKEEVKSTRNEWANQCLFDYKGQKLKAFDKFCL